MNKDCNEIIFKDDFISHADIITYPDGQRTVRLRFDPTDNLDIKKPVTIKCRIKYYSDLEILDCLLSALQRTGYVVKTVTFMYLFGLRCDRPFHAGEPDYVDDVLSPLVSNILYAIGNVDIFCPHSEIGILKFSKDIRAEYLGFQDDLEDEFEGKYVIFGDSNNFNFISDSNFGKCMYLPEGLDGEAKRFFRKKRVDKGIIIEGHGPDGILEMRKEPDIVIVDDMCDGGATFIEEAKYLRAQGHTGKLKLFVIHGLFTKGLDELLEYFDEIICTNSYQDIDHPKVKQIKVI